MKLRFDKHLPAAPEVAWQYLTWPERMNMWSEAKVESVTSPEGGRPDVVCATRRVKVTVLGRTFPLLEEVEEASPPVRFVYRVTQGGGLSGHRGVMTLDRTASGTLLVWEVEYNPRLPGLGFLMKWVVGRAVRRSLVVLERILRETPTLPAASAAH